MTLQVSRIDASGNVTVNDATFSNGGSLNFNQTITTSNNYWIRSYSNAKRTIKSIAYGNGIYVAVSSTNTYIETSSDGYVWTNRTSANVTTSGTAAAYGNGVYVVGGTSGAVQSSTDGINWTNRTRANTNAIYALTYDNGLFVGVGAAGSIVTSADGTTWNNRTTANTSDMNAIAFGNGVYVAVGASGATQYSSNGINWTNTTRANTNNLNALTYGNGLFVAGGGNGAVVTSSDGITWANRTRANSNPIVALTYFSNTFIAFHANSSYNTSLTNISVTTSNDGITWVNQNTVSYLLPMARNISNTVAVGDGKLVVGINPLVDISNSYANNGTFPYEQFLISPSFPNTMSFSFTDNANNTALAIKNTSAATVLTNNYSFLQSLTVNNSIYQDFDGTVNTQIFTANGYWIKPAWANTGQELVIINLIGAGGGAIKSSYLTTAAGGGGGAFVWGIFMSSECDAICNVVVGTGGAAGSDTSGSWTFASDGGNSIFYHDSTKNLFLTAYGGRGGGMLYTAPNSGSFRGGGGGGWLSSANSYPRGGSPSGREYGGEPTGGNSSVLDSEFGGGTGGGANSTAGISIYGGGGGGGSNNTVVSTGGNSFYGAAGGSGNSTASISIFLNSGNGGVTGGPSGIGGGAAPDTTSAIATQYDRGGRGEVRVYTIRKLS